MVNKKLLIVTILLVVGAAAVVFIDESRKNAGRDPKLGKSLVEQTALPAVDRIVIESGEKRVTLVKASEVWRLGGPEGFPVDPSKVIRLFDDLANVVLERVVADTKEELEAFGLGSATTVGLYEGDAEVVSLKVLDRRDKGGQYLAVGGEYKAYLTGQNLSVLADEESWEQKKLLDIAKDQIKTIAFTPHGKEPVTLTREKSEDALAIQDLPAGRQARSNVKNQETLLQGLSFTKRYDPSNEEAKAALATPHKVRFTLFDGRVVEILTGSVGKDKKKHFVRISTSLGEVASDDGDARLFLLVNELMEKNAFEIGQWVADKFAKGMEDFVEPATADKGDKKSGKG